MVAVLPLNRSLFRRVDVFFGARFEQESLHVLFEKAAGLRVHDVQAVVIDQHSLLTKPLGPAILADSLDNSLADLAGERRALETWFGLAAASAGDGRHEILGRYCEI